MSTLPTALRLAQFEELHVESIEGTKRITEEGLQEFRVIMADDQALDQFLKIEQQAPAYVSYSSRGGESWDEAFDRVRYNFATFLTTVRDTSLEGRELVVEALCTPRIARCLYVSIGRDVRGTGTNRYDTETPQSENAIEMQLFLQLSRVEQTTFIKANLDRAFGASYPKLSERLFLNAEAVDQSEILATEGGQMKFGSIDKKRLKVPMPTPIQNLQGQLEKPPSGSVPQSAVTPQASG